jgi:glutaryl-CoA dehydrogenase
MKGLAAPAIKNKLALRASLTGSVFMDNVKVPHDQLLPKSIGLGSAFSCLNSARYLLVPLQAIVSSTHRNVGCFRYGIAWGVMGALEDCIKRTLEYALERKQFKRPIASFQLIQKKLVDAQTEVALGLLASHQVGKLQDAGQIAPEMVSMVKRNNCGKALQQARTLLDILGGNASSDEYASFRSVNLVLI